MKYYGPAKAGRYIKANFGVDYNAAREAIDASEATKTINEIEDGVSFTLRQWSEDDLNRIGQELACPQAWNK